MIMVVLIFQVQAIDILKKQVIALKAQLVAFKVCTRLTVLREV